MGGQAAEIGCLPEGILGLPNVVIVCGHYGVGKTNFSLNMAYDLAEAGRSVTLVDLDIVNPYFRSSDHADALECAGIRLLCPASAGTALDAPMLSVAIGEAISDAQQDANAVCIVDAGGDDVGMVALGRYAKTVAAGPYAMLYVANALREQTLAPQDAVALLPEMEAACHLRATHVVNNTHLMDETDAGVVERGQAFAQEVATALDLPLLCTAVPLAVQDGRLDTQDDAAYPEWWEAGDTVPCANPYFVRIYVKKPWDA